MEAGIQRKQWKFNFWMGLNEMSQVRYNTSIGIDDIKGDVDE